MRLVITGGAGFIGSHLCDSFIAQGHEVICVDNLITGQRSNIAHLEGHKNFYFLEQDVTQDISVSGTVDFVLHLASPASPRDFSRFPVETLITGAMGTFRALSLAREKGAKFFLASSAGVYGEPLVNPQSESYYGNVDPTAERAVYQEAKRFAEALTTAFHRLYHLDIRIARIFNTYGPRMRLDDGRVIPTFIVQALRGEPVTIFGDGSQTRTFCYISDLVEGIRRLLSSEVAEPINLGSSQEVAILALVRKVVELTRSSSPVLFRSPLSGDPHGTRPDISWAKKLLGWEPEVDLNTGLLTTIQWFKPVVAWTL